MYSFNEFHALDEGKKKGLWANIHAKRKRGERPARPGEKDYPKTLNVEEVEQIDEVAPVIAGVAKAGLVGAKMVGKLAVAAGRGAVAAGKGAAKATAKSAKSGAKGAAREVGKGIGYGAATAAIDNYRKEEVINEEDYDRMKDRRMERGGAGGNQRRFSSRKATNAELGIKPGKTALQKEMEKKHGKGASAMDIVTAEILAKHGKNAIKDTKK